MEGCMGGERKIKLVTPRDYTDLALVKEESLGFGFGYRYRYTNEATAEMHFFQHLKETKYDDDDRKRDYISILYK